MGVEWQNVNIFLERAAKWWPPLPTLTFSRQPYLQLGEGEFKRSRQLACNIAAPSYTLSTIQSQYILFQNIIKTFLQAAFLSCNCYLLCYFPLAHVMRFCDLMQQIKCWATAPPQSTLKMHRTFFGKLTKLFWNKQTHNSGRCIWNSFSRNYINYLNEHLFGLKQI